MRYKIANLGFSRQLNNCLIIRVIRGRLPFPAWRDFVFHTPLTKIRTYGSITSVREGGHTVCQRIREVAAQAGRNTRQTVNLAGRTHLVQTVKPPQKVLSYVPSIATTPCFANLAHFCGNSIQTPIYKQLTFQVASSPVRPNQAQSRLVKVNQGVFSVWPSEEKPGQGNGGQENGTTHFRITPTCPAIALATADDHQNSDSSASLPPPSSFGCAFAPLRLGVEFLLVASCQLRVSASLRGKSALPVRPNQDQSRLNPGQSR